MTHKSIKMDIDSDAASSMGESLADLNDLACMQSDNDEMESDDVINEEVPDTNLMLLGIRDNASLNPRPPSPIDVIAKQSEIEDDGCSIYLVSGFDQVPDLLRNKSTDTNFNLSLDICDELFDLLRPQPQYETTMDAVSKTLSTIPFGDVSNYMQPYEGMYWYFLSESNGMTLSPHISNVLYFFYMLENYIQEQGITNFVVRTETLSPEFGKTAKNNKIVVGISERMNDVSHSDGMNIDEDNGTFNTSHLFRQRVRQSSCDLKEERKPFSVKVAFTGALFEIEEETKQMLFSMVVITPIKNFNLYDYINHVFLNAPRNPQLKDQWKTLCACWKHILMYEANHNCNLNGDPMTFKTNPGGEMGFFTMCHMLSVPYRIFNVIHKQNARPTDIRIMGCPKLHFDMSGSDNGYEDFFHKSVNVATEIYEALNRDLAAYLSTSEQKKDASCFLVKNAGGWPLKTVLIEDENGPRLVFQRLGHFTWPLLADVNYYKPMGDLITKDGYLLNIGSVLPLMFTKKIRDFMTYDSNANSLITISDKHILKSTEQWTPLRVFEEYYGSEHNVDDLRDTKLVKWYVAFLEHVRNARANGTMTIDEAMVQLNLHLFNCMRQHENIARADGYGSKFFKQCMYMMDNYLKTELKNVSLSSNLSQMTKCKIHPFLRHNTYLKNSYFLMLSMYILNKDMRLNPLNLEMFMENLLSGVHWHVGSHSHTFIAFFQCSMIISCAGHLDMAVEKEQMQMDWRKPNTSGAGFTQSALNRYFDELGKLFLIMKDQSKIKIETWNRTTTGGLENETCVTLIEDRRVAEPAAEFKYNPYAYTENRKKNTPYETLVQIGLPRDESSLYSKIFSTADPLQTGQRALYTKIPITHVHFWVFSTNEPPPLGDIPQTLYVVMHALDPGCDAYKKLSDTEMAFNSGETEM